MSQSSESKKLSSRPDKTIRWLNKSRDGWRDKTLATKSELKVVKQAQKRARESREEWKNQYNQLETAKQQQDRILKLDFAKFFKFWTGFDLQNYAT
jgi:hypothetical protein